MSPRVAKAARWLLGALLIWAGAAKLAAPRLFFLALLDYRLPAPDTALRLIAVTLPWIELLCGLALCIDRWAETVRPLAAALCGAFVVATGQAWLRGLEISCGCFGAKETGVWATPAVAFFRALLLLSLALWLVTEQRAAASGGRSARTPRKVRS